MEMEMVNKIFKQNNANQASKSQCYKIRMQKLQQKYKWFFFFHSKISDIESDYPYLQ